MHSRIDARTQAPEEGSLPQLLLKMGATVGEGAGPAGPGEAGEGKAKKPKKGVSAAVLQMRENLLQSDTGGVCACERVGAACACACVCARLRM